MPSEAGHKLRLKPFIVPYYAIAAEAPHLRQEGLREAAKFALSELAPETLDALCTEFRAGVFARAGKADPHA
jgi:hypothetical protein